VNTRQRADIAALDNLRPSLGWCFWKGTRGSPNSPALGNEGKRTALTSRNRTEGCGFLSLNLHFFLGGTFSTSNFVSFRTCNQPELKQMTTAYRQYIQSNSWRSKKLQFIEARKGVQKCYLCKVYTPCDLHHRTYQHLGSERHSELRLLCRECHGFVHDRIKFSGGKASKLDKKLAKSWSDHCTRYSLWGMRDNEPEKFSNKARAYFQHRLESDKTLPRTQ
jgi:hypothetical protein